MSEQKRNRELEQWKIAVLRRNIRERVRAGEPALLVAEDYGVPIQFVEVIASWQMFEDEPTPPTPEGSTR